MKLVKEGATAKFDESVDVSINLGIDAKKSDQTVRGSIVLPQGTGKSVRIAVFAQGDRAAQAKAAGAGSLLPPCYHFVPIQQNEANKANAQRLDFPNSSHPA